MESADPQGYATLKLHFALVCNSNLDPSSLARDLFAKGLITSHVKQEANSTQLDKNQKLDKILEGVMANGERGVFQTFIDIIRREHQWLVDKLEGMQMSNVNFYA